MPPKLRLDKRRPGLPDMITAILAGEEIPYSIEAWTLLAQVHYFHDYNNLLTGEELRTIRAAMVTMREDYFADLERARRRR